MADFPGTGAEATKSDLTALSDCQGEFNEMADFTLTTGSDTVAGTANNDTVNGTAGTLNTGDSLAGGAGTDVLALVGDCTSASISWRASRHSCSSY